MNHNYAHIVNPSSLEYAPDALATPTGLEIAPPMSHYVAAGWLPVKLSPPSPPEGQQVAAREYVETDGHIDYAYTYEDIPPRNLSLSKRKLMNALKAAGKWEAVRSWMEANEAWDDWTMATTLDERDPMMQQAIAALPALGVSPDEIDAILLASGATM